MEILNDIVFVLGVGGVVAAAVNLAAQVYRRTGTTPIVAACIWLILAGAVIVDTLVKLHSVEYRPDRSTVNFPFFFVVTYSIMLSLRGTRIITSDPLASNLRLIRNLFGEKAALRVELAVRRNARRAEIARQMGISRYEVMRREARGEIELFD